MTELTGTPWIQILLALFSAWVIVIFLFWSLRVTSVKGRLGDSAAYSVISAFVSIVVAVVMFVVLRGGLPNRWFFITLAVALIPGVVFFLYWRKRLRQSQRRERA